jgi:hypothetical protein
MANYATKYKKNATANCPPKMVWFMVINATFYNISIISWQWVLLVEETGENHRLAASHW